MVKNVGTPDELGLQYSGFVPDVIQNVEFMWNNFRYGVTLTE
jgi:hypothetical protein